MHGRLKVRTTAEQQEAKRKEREKKLVLYRAATERISAKRKDNELDQEMLNLTGELLSANPDYYTLWNIRREAFQKWKTTKTEDDLQRAFDNELSFLEHCLRTNPKSYGGWQQRGWVMENMSEPNWKREMMLCTRFLEYDERNFHCWDYRRFVVSKCGISSDAELKFTSDKISANFSNFSSWHYRSLLLPVVYTDPTQPTGVREDIVQQEFNLVQNAFFTDPNDQSAWFYHKWLLGKGGKSLAIDSVCINKNERQILTVLTRQAKIDKDFSFSLIINDEKQDVKWSSPYGKYSLFWISNLDDSVLNSDNEYSFKLSMFEPTGQSLMSEVMLRLSTKDDHCYWKETPSGKVFQHDLGAATSDILSQEIESCKQLHEMEPDNKWVILTLLSLMRALEPVRYQSDTMSYLDKLLILDPMRTNYYADLRSKFILEDAIQRLEPSEQSFSVSDQRLTAAYHMEHLVHMTLIDLSQNSLTDFKPGFLLPFLKELNLDKNRLSNCDGLEQIHSLEILHLRDNEICDVSNLSSLRLCRRLHTIQLEGNPVMNIPDSREIISKLLPSISHTL